MLSWSNSCQMRKRLYVIRCGKLSYSRRRNGYYLQYDALAAQAHQRPDSSSIKSQKIEDSTGSLAYIYERPRGINILTDLRGATTGQNVDAHHDTVPECQLRPPAVERLHKERKVSMTACSRMFTAGTTSRSSAVARRNRELKSKKRCLTSKFPIGLIVQRL